MVLLLEHNHWVLLPLLIEDYGEDIPPEHQWAMRIVDEFYKPSQQTNWRGSGTPQPPRPPYPPTPKLHMESAWGKFRIPPQ
eukprot:9702684-Prorocentrum_lima.AAC.1